MQAGRPGAALGAGADEPAWKPRLASPVSEQGPALQASWSRAFSSVSCSISSRRSSCRSISSRSISSRSIVWRPRAFSLPTCARSSLPPFRDGRSSLLFCGLCARPFLCGDGALRPLDLALLASLGLCCCFRHRSVLLTASMLDLAYPQMSRAHNSRFVRRNQSDQCGARGTGVFACVSSNADCVSCGGPSPPLAQSRSSTV